ncbi:MAG: MarC family protein [Venatoribacter sp.]
MGDTAVLAFATLFATISPIDVAAIYAAITVGSSIAQKRRMAVRGVLIASIVLGLFAAMGNWLLTMLGISLAALRTAGGIMLLLMGLDMVFARGTANTTTDEEDEEAIRKHDVSVFPLALPLLAGPGSMSALIILMAQAQGDVLQQAVIYAVLAVVMLIALGCLLLSSHLNRVLGVSGMQTITRVMGVLLCALAVQFVFDGVAESELFKALLAR